MIIRKTGEGHPKSKNPAGSKRAFAEAGTTVKGSGAPGGRKVREATNRGTQETGEETDAFLSLLAFDPGGTTGWAVFDVHRDAIMQPNTSLVPHIRHWTAGEITGSDEEQGVEIFALLDAWPYAAVVREDFILRSASRTMSRELLSPVRIGTLIDWLVFSAQNRHVAGKVRGKEQSDVYEMGPRGGSGGVAAERDGRGARARMQAAGTGSGIVLKQQPSLAKTYATDERLRSAGFYVVGSDHARDAVRHALLCLRRCADDHRLARRAWGTRLLGEE